MLGQRLFLLSKLTFGLCSIHLASETSRRFQFRPLLEGEFVPSSPKTSSMAHGSGRRIHLKTTSQALRLLLQVVVVLNARLQPSNLRNQPGCRVCLCWRVPFFRVEVKPNENPSVDFLLGGGSRFRHTHPQATGICCGHLGAWEDEKPCAGHQQQASSQVSCGSGCGFNW